MVIILLMFSFINIENMKIYIVKKKKVGNVMI